LADRQHGVETGTEKRAMAARGDALLLDLAAKFGRNVELQRFGLAVNLDIVGVDSQAQNSAFDELEHHRSPLRRQMLDCIRDLNDRRLLNGKQACSENILADLVSRLNGVQWSEIEVDALEPSVRRRFAIRVSFMANSSAEALPISP